MTIDVKLPFTVLMQKFDFHLDDQFCREDFAKVFLFNRLQRKATLEEADDVFKDAIVLS